MIDVIEILSALSKWATGMKRTLDHSTVPIVVAVASSGKVL